MTQNTQDQIRHTCDSIKSLLLHKNEKYGDSALNPKRVFSKADAVEQIKVRIDDKLSRIATTGFSAADEDTLQDLIGYLVLLKIALGRREDVSRPLTYEDVLEDHAAAAAAGEEPLEEYGLGESEDIFSGATQADWVDFWDNFNHAWQDWANQALATEEQEDSNVDSLWDPSLGPVDLSEEEIQSILDKKNPEQFEADEVVSIIHRRGLIIGVKADGSTCLLNDSGQCQ